MGGLAARGPPLRRPVLVPRRGVVAGACAWPCWRAGRARIVGDARLSTAAPARVSRLLFPRLNFESGSGGSVRL